MSKPVPSAAVERSGWGSIYPLWFGAFLGLALLKWGNPVILDKLIEAPNGLLEVMFQSWPASWGYGLLFILVGLGVPLVKYRAVKPGWVVWLPMLWLGWQMLAATRTVDTALTYATLPHFISCVVCFYAGYLIVGGLPHAQRIWPGLLAGFCYVLYKGFNQHYGELEETRRYFFLYTDPGKITPEMVGKMNSDRIFATLLYPNTFAGVILLLLPASLVYLINGSERWPRILRGTGLGVLIYMGAACLLWSGSKAGLLIGLVMGMAVMLQIPLSRTLKLVLIGGVLVGGLTGFVLKYRSYIEKGATSVGARIDYWKVGGQMALEKPLLGSGPGTFQVVYQARKPREAEMARLAHNDYLQQASDSGVIGFLTYTAFIFGSLVILYRNSGDFDAFYTAIWLGFFGLALQGLVEFWLYIPAIGWLVFFFVGWMWGGVGKRQTERQV